MLDNTTVDQRAPILIEYLHPSQLFIDQKTLVNPRMPWERIPHLKKIAAKFDWNKFNTLKVAKRGDDRYAILDGGGSFYLVTELLPQFRHLLLPCHVVDEHVRTRIDEAGIFQSQKDRKRLTAENFYQGDLIAKDPEAIGIKSILKNVGMVMPGLWPAGMKSVPTARTLYREHVLERTLVLARACWGAIHAIENTHLVAIGILIHAHPDIDEQRLRKVLSANDPRALQENLFLQRGKMHMYTQAATLAHEYVSLYDRDFRGKLIGGDRSNGKYAPSPRLKLNQSCMTLVNSWKMVSRPKE